jgi:hypothetical protein
MPPTEQSKSRVARLFAKPLLGWSCLIMLALLFVLLAVSLFYILPLLTQPPGFIEKHLEKAPNMDASFAVALEYESYAIRAQGIQIALGFIVGLFMAAFGLLLFAIGATDDFGFDGTYKEAKLNLKSTAPGLVVIVISGFIICFAVTKDVRRSFDASYKTGGDPRIETRTGPPPPTKAIN